MPLHNAPLPLRCVQVTRPGQWNDNGPSWDARCKKTLRLARSLKNSPTTNTYFGHLVWFIVFCFFSFYLVSVRYDYETPLRRVIVVITKILAVSSIIINALNIEKNYFKTAHEKSLFFFFPSALPNLLSNWGYNMAQIPND